MSTRTLGIKFEIAGVKEAQSQLKQFKKSLNQSLADNKQAFNQVVKFESKLPRILLKNKSGKQEIEIKNSYHSKELSNVGNEFIKKLEKLINSSKKISKNFLGNVVTGFQEGIGNSLANKYVGGLNEGLKGKLFNFFQSSGNRQGEIVTKGINFVADSPEKIQQFGLNKFFDISDIYLEGLKSKKDIKEIGIDIAKELFNPQPFKEQFQKIIDQSVNSAKSIPQLLKNKLDFTKGVSKTRAKKLEREGYEKLIKTLRDKSNPVDNIDVNEDTEEIVLVVGGFAGKRGRSGDTFAKQIASMSQDNKTQYVGVRNKFTDVVNVREAYGGTESGQIESIRKILRMFQEVHKLGFNPDAVKLAAKTIKLQQQNPELPIKLAGYSGGGYVVEDAMKLLQLFGADMSKIQGKGIATPNLPGSVKSKDYQKTLGENDPIFEINSLKEINKKAQEIFGIDIFSGLSEDIQNIKDIDNHFLDSYIIFSEEVREFLYGQNSNVEELIDIHKEIIAVQSIIDKSTQSMSELVSSSKSKGFNLAAFEQLQNVYIESSQRLQELAKQAKKVGGGSYYNTIEKQSTEALEQLGVKPQAEKSNQNIKKDVDYSNQEIAKAYKKQLKKIIENSSKQARQAIEKGDINLNIDRAYQDISKKIAEYRKRLSESSFKEARKIGEELLQKTEYLKQLFAQSGDTRKGQLTRIQTEILEGDRGQGRANVGLAEAAYNPGITQLELDFERTYQAPGETIGQQVTEGFKQGASGQEAGKDFAEDLIEAVEEELDIESPSKVFEYIGKMVKAGFANGIEGIFGSVEDELAEGTERTYQAAEETSAVLSSKGGLIDGIKSLFGSLENRFPLIKKFKKGILAIAGLFLGGMGINFIVSAFGRLRREFLAVAMEVESLDKSILFSSRNFKKGIDNLNFVSQTAKNLKVDLNQAKEAYAGLISAAKNTPLEGEQIKRVFTAFAESASNRGINVQGQQRLFTALEQIIGKRKLQREEVNGQIGDIRGFGDFQNLIAQAQGISTSQLEEQMERGQIGLDVLPKVAAILEAQNAAADSTQTAVQAQTKYNNALLEFKTLVGGILQPFQKFIYNLLGDGLDFLTTKLVSFGKILVNLIGVILLGLLTSFRILPILIQAIRVALVGLINTLQTLLSMLPTLIPLLAKFIAAYALVAAAIATVGNLINLSKNQYQNLNEEVDKLTDSMNHYAIAVEEAAGAQAQLQGSKGLQLNEGVKLPKWLQGIAGGERLNLDNLFRNRFYKKGSRNIFGQELFTEAQKRQADFQVASGNANFKTNQLLMQFPRARKAAEKIADFDEQIRAVQSKRLEILPGDKAALEASLAEERLISKERDKQLKILTTYQQSLNTALAINKNALLTLETRNVKGEFEPEFYQQQRNNLLEVQSATQDRLEKINNIISEVSKTLSAFQKELRNSNERVKGFIENRARKSQQERTQIIEEGLENQEGERVIQLKLDKVNRRELRDNIREIEKTIAASQKRLQSAALSEGYNLIQQSAETNNLPLTSTTIERMLQEERSQGEKDALGELKQLRELEGQLYQNQEQLAQNLQQNRTTLIDFNRTITDYFFRLSQEIKEAQVEVKRLINQLFYGDIKSKLRSAIAPGSESFLNGIIESVQGIIDQAASIAEKVLGQDSALISFESKQYDLQTQLQDFARQIAGASDAVRGFIGSLRGQGSRGAAVQGGAETLTALRRAIIGKESGANFKAVNPHSGALGYGQVMPANVASWTKQALGKSLTSQQFLSNADAQIKTIDHKLNQYLQRELKATGNNLGLAVRRVASTWYSGRPKLYDDARPQRYGAGSYPSIRDYTTDILRRFRKEKGTNAPTVNDFPNSVTTLDNNTLENAQKLNQQLLTIEQNKIRLNNTLIEQEKELLGISIDQQQGRNARTFTNQAREAERAAQQLRDRQTNLKFESQLPTAEVELEKNLISKQTQFRDFDNEIYQQLQKLTDFVRTAQNFSAIAPNEIAKLRASGTQAGMEAAQFLEETLKQTEQALPGYLALIKEIAQIQTDLPKAQAEAIKFIQEQGKLKIEQQELQKQSVISQLKLNIATVRGTNSERQQLEIAQEKLRLEERINQIRQQYGDSDFAQQLIKTEQENSQAQTIKINDQAVNRELNLEQQLINLNRDKAGKKAGLLNFMGLEFEANKVQRDNAIEAEAFRYKQQIEQLKQSYRGEPEKLAELLKNAQELNRVNLDNIQIQFKTLRTQIQQIGLQNLQGFFSNLFTLFTTSGERQQQILQANLNYAQQLNQAHDKYKRNPAELAQAKNRLKELNNQKLDGIRNEFNLFNRVVNFAKQALAEVFKSLAQIAAKKAASAIFKAVGLGFADGGTVPNFADGGSVGENQNRIVPTRTYQAPGQSPGVLSSSLASFLSKSSPPIQKAFQREGKRGVLAVFTPGEEILSLRTGEAQRYQALKRELGINPLASIGNFSDGGTVENNLLGSISSRPSFRFDASSFNKKSSNSITRTGTVNINVTTPDADSFRMSEHQLGLDAAESLRRSLRR